MSTTQNKAAVRVAVIAGVALSVAGTAGIANAETTPAGSSAAVQSAGAPAATPSVAGLTAKPGAVTVADAGNTAAVTVSRVSVATGPQTGGTVLTVLGANLAEEVVEAPAAPASTATTTAVSWTTPTVKFTIPAVRGGTATTITAEDVTVLSDGAVRVVVPPSDVVGKAVITVTNGITSDPKKSPSFTYTAAAPVVTSVTGTPTSEAGGTVTINGTYLGDKATKVLIGGKAAKVDDKSTSSTLTVAAPIGLTGVQDVVVSTKGGTVDVGTVTYAATPVTVVWGTPSVTYEKGATITVTGTNLNKVIGGTFTDSTNKVIKLTVKQPTATADSGTSLTVVIPAKAAAADDGTIVLNTAYASSTPQTINVVKVGTPTITPGAKLTTAGGSLVLQGTNLHYITSVKVGTTTLDKNAYESDGSTLTMTVPTQTRVPALVSIVVTTDGGAVTYQLPVSTTTLTGASYDAETKKVTLNGTSLGSLTGISLKRGTTPVSTKFTAAEGGTTSVSTAISAGLTDGATYTVTARDASGLSFSTNFIVGTVTPPAATGTIASASYAGGVLTVGGTDLEDLTEVTVTGTGPVVAAKTVTLGAGSTSATVTTALTAGAYTVTAKNSAGAAVGPVNFTVAPQITAVTYDAVAKTVTVTGTDLDTVASFTLTGTGGPVTGVTLDPSSTATAAVLQLTDVLLDGGYTVTAKDSAGASVGEKAFTVATQ